MERRQVTAARDRSVSSLRGFDGLFVQDGRNRVDGGVHLFDAPEVCLDTC